MKELKGSTKAGKNIIGRTLFNIGYYLDDVYNNYSHYKTNAWDWCYKQFKETESSYNFHICGANSMQFSVAWYGKKDGENILRYETRDNSYLVWLDR